MHGTAFWGCFNQNGNFDCLWGTDRIWAQQLLSTGFTRYNDLARFSGVSSDVVDGMAAYFGLRRPNRILEQLKCSGDSDTVTGNWDIRDSHLACLTLHAYIPSGLGSSAFETVCCGPLTARGLGDTAEQLSRTLQLFQLTELRLAFIAAAVPRIVGTSHKSSLAVCCYAAMPCLRSTNIASLDIFEEWLHRHKNSVTAFRAAEHTGVESTQSQCCCRKLWTALACGRGSDWRLEGDSDRQAVES